MMQLMSAPAEKRWEQRLLFSGRSNDFGPIPFHARKMAAILEIFGIAVLTNLLMLVSD